MENQEKDGKLKILIATAFPTHGAGSGALVTTQATSYVADGYPVHIITGDNRTDFAKIPGVEYHIVPFTAETKDAETIDGQVPFNYLMFTSHTESTANFWNVPLGVVEQYCNHFKKALVQETKEFNPDVIHAQHNWLLSSEATRMGKPVVTTVHGTDLKGYDELARVRLAGAKSGIEQIMSKGDSKLNKDFAELEEIYHRSSSFSEIERRVKESFPEYQFDRLPDKDVENLLKGNIKAVDASDGTKLVQLLNERTKYEFYMREAENSARNSDKIIVISESQKKKFIKLFPYAADKVELVKNGYDPKKFYVDRNITKEQALEGLVSNSTPDGKIPADFDKMVLFVGKFADFKGIDSMLIATKIYEERMKAKGKKVATIIVGSGALEKGLKAEAEKLGLENTHFVGRQDHNRINKLQNIADVSLIPSRNEPFGLVVIEGTACGHPVIACNSGGIPDILNTTGEEMPKKDIAQTKLGLLVRAVPVRPELTNDEFDQLNVLLAQYMTEKDDAEKEKCRVAIKHYFGISEEDLDEYVQATNNLADAVEKTLEGEYQFDNAEIADYTQREYSQGVITRRILDIFRNSMALNRRRRVQE